METIKCINCGAPDQSPVAECKYCGYQPPIKAEPETVQASPGTASNVVTLQGDISRFKLLLTSLLVGWAVMALSQMVLGGRL